MHTLIEEMFRNKFTNDILDEQSDSAIIGSVPAEGNLAFTTDSYVINPIFFPGGDIGKLAICGTINDLSVAGAKPRYMSCGFIIEEGLDFDVLEKVTDSMAETAKDEDIGIVTGDTKVVEKGMCDKLFINTSGIGIRDTKLNFSPNRIAPGDKIIINGSIGEHGIATLIARGDFHFDADILSDCACLWSLIREICDFHIKVVEKGRGEPIKFMRDPTRGGLATTLHETAQAMKPGIVINEEDIPVEEGVESACEILGFDPLFVANEGKVVLVVSKDYVEDILRIMKRHPLGRKTRVIGEVVKNPESTVLMKTRIGGKRIIEMIVGDQLPRIC